MTAQLSRERLEALANLQSLECLALPASHAESAEMARMLLAGMSSEPVAVPDERKAFEEFMEKRFKDSIDRRQVKNGDGEYMAWDMQVAWIAWQKRAAMLNAGPVTRWIKCSERMPELGVDVLACNVSPIGGYEEIETAQWHGGMKGNQPVFITSADTIEPELWMPLPEAPEQEV